MSRRLTWGLPEVYSNQNDSATLQSHTLHHISKNILIYMRPQTTTLAFLAFGLHRMWCMNALMKNISWNSHIGRGVFWLTKSWKPCIPFICRQNCLYEGPKISHKNLLSYLQICHVFFLLRGRRKLFFPQWNCSSLKGKIQYKIKPALEPS